MGDFLCFECVAIAYASVLLPTCALITPPLQSIGQLRILEYLFEDDDGGIDKDKLWEVMSRSHAM